MSEANTNETNVVPAGVRVLSCEHMTPGMVQWYELEPAVTRETADGIKFEATWACLCEKCAKIGEKHGNRGTVLLQLCVGSFITTEEIRSDSELEEVTLLAADGASESAAPHVVICRLAHDEQRKVHVECKHCQRWEPWPETTNNAGFLIKWLDTFIGEHKDCKAKEQ